MAGVKGRSGAKTQRHWNNIAEYREKIQTAKIINRLTQHVLGDGEMEPSQVTAALGLLKKVLPDTKETTIQGDEDNPLNVVGTITWQQPHNAKSE